MIDPGDNSNDHTDVGVSSLGDRRRIKELEAQVAKLEDRVRDLGSLTPGITRHHGDCMHGGSFEVSDTIPEVICCVCGKVLDPWTVLRKIAHREVNFCYTLRSLRAESAHLEKTTKALRKTLGSLKTRVKKKTPDVGVEELGEFMTRVGAEAFVINRVGAGWGSSFRFRDGFRGTKDYYGKGNGIAVAIRGAMDHVDDHQLDPSQDAGGKP